MKSAPGKYAFVIPYYGKWPFYWTLWAQSAAKNTQFDFLVLTDLPRPTLVPHNVHIIYMELPKLQAALSKVIDVRLANLHYHKLCDFKPFYGLAFPELLRPYKYWGYCDIDLFFGNLGPLAERADSGEFDFISPFNFTVGHCTLMRNDPQINEIALGIADLKARCCEPDTTFMDEGAISQAGLAAGARCAVVLNLDQEWRKPKPFLGATARADGSLAGMPGWFLIHYENGRVLWYDKDLQSHEMVYFHFMGMKAARYWRELGNCDLENFSFSSYGIIPGLLNPAVTKSPRFWARSLAFHAPGYAYRAARNLIPERVIHRLRYARRAMLSWDVPRSSR